MSYIGNQPFNASLLTDTFSGNGINTSFNLSVAPASSNAILVTINGILQNPSSYGVVGSTLSFSGIPPSGTENIVVRYLALPASNVTTSAYRSVTELIATANQTTFSVSSYTPGFIDVFRNGVRLATDDYTATNGAQVVLATPAIQGDVIQTVSFYVSSVLNAIPAVANAVGSTYITDGGIVQSKLDVGRGTGVGAMQLPIGTTTDRPTAPASGMLRWNTSLNQIEAYTAVSSEWIALNPKLGSVSRPAQNAVAIIAAGASTGNGVYYIATTTGTVPVYCDMDNGGYMLVAKISSSNLDTWLYNGSNWTTSVPVNESGVQTLANEDAVSRLYYETLTTAGLRLCLGSVSNGLIESRVGVTAKSVFTGSQSGSSNSRAQFLSWFQTGTGQSSTNFDNQPNCNTAGFNVTSVSGAAMRWGITMNNEADCSSNDAAVGFGTYTNSYPTPAQGVRNVAAGGHRWNPDARYSAQGFIFIK